MKSNNSNPKPIYVQVPFDPLAPQLLSPAEILDLVTRVRAADARIRTVRNAQLKEIRHAQALRAVLRKRAQGG